MTRCAFMSPMRVGMVGSAGFAAPERVRSYVEKLHAGCTLVVQRGCRGAVRDAVKIARLRGLKVQVIHRAAGPLPDGPRCRAVVEQCETLVAFWDGTRDDAERALRLARSLGRSAEILLVPRPVGLTLELRR